MHLGGHGKVAIKKGDIYPYALYAAIWQLGQCRGMRVMPSTILGKSLVAGPFKFVFAPNISVIYKVAWPETYASIPDLYTSIPFLLEFRHELNRLAFLAS
jgi:hypothetical protein